MTTVLRVGVLAILTGAAFVAGRASSDLGKRASSAAAPGADTSSGTASPAGLAPWAEHGFRDGETCEDVFQNPG